MVRATHSPALLPTTHTRPGNPAGVAVDTADELTKMATEGGRDNDEPSFKARVRGAAAVAAIPVSAYPELNASSAFEEMNTEMFVQL